MSPLHLLSTPYVFLHYLFLFYYLTGIFYHKLPKTVFQNKFFCIRSLLHPGHLCSGATDLLHCTVQRVVCLFVVVVVVVFVVSAAAVAVVLLLLPLLLLLLLLLFVLFCFCFHRRR